MILARTVNSTVSNNIITNVTTGIILCTSFLDKITGNNIDAYNGISANGTGTQITGNSITSQNIAIGTDGEYQTVAENTIRTSEWQGNMVKISGSYTNVTKNTLTGTSYTYAIVDGHDNVVYGNKIIGSYGLRVTSDRNIITRNNINGGSLSVSGLNNTVCVNTLTNGFGLTVAGHNNLYYANQIQNNSIGADLSGLEAYSSNNRIYQNNFIGNAQQIKNYDNKGNFWDNGSIGNYWSDYNGTDQNGDGIGDTPYPIPGQLLDQKLRRLIPIITGQDNYPLITPFNIKSISVQLPEWTPNLTLPVPAVSPSPSLSPTPSPSPAATPTPPVSTQSNPITSPSASPPTSPASSTSGQPTQSAQGRTKLFTTEDIYLIAAGVAALAIVVTVAIIIRKRKHPPP